MTTEIETRRCNECGDLKEDVRTRTWDNLDGPEWDFLCLSCAEKKKRNSKLFTVFFIGWVIVSFSLLMILAAIFTTGLFT